MDNTKIEYDSFQGDICLIPPNGFILGKTKEYFYIPRNILVLCVGRSSYARCGIITNVTPLEPEWEGYVTIEISNTNVIPARVYSGYGISQFIFFDTDKECRISYKDKKGKYNKQKFIELAKGL